MSSILIDRIISYDAPADGEIYGRYNNRWIKINLTPYPIGWYLKSTSCKVDNDGNNITDYVLKPEIEFVEETDGPGTYRLKKDSDGKLILNKVQKKDTDGTLLFEDEDKTIPLYEETNSVPYIMEASDKIKKPLEEETFIPIYVYADGTELEASTVEWKIVALDDYDEEITVNDDDGNPIPCGKLDQYGNKITCASVNSNGLVKSFKGARVKLICTDLKYGFEDLNIKWNINRTQLGLKIRGIPSEFNKDGSTKIPQKLKEINNPDYLRAVFVFDDGSEDEIPYNDVFWIVDVDTDIINYTIPTNTSDTHILFECFKYDIAQIRCTHKNHISEQEYTDILRWRIGKLIQKIEICEVVPASLLKVNNTEQFHVKVYQGDDPDDSTTWTLKNPDSNGYYLGNDVDWFFGIPKDDDLDGVQDTYSTGDKKWDIDSTAGASVTPQGTVTTLHSGNLVLVAQIQEDAGNETHTFTDYVKWEVIRTVTRIDIVENSGINTEVGLFDASGSARNTKFHAIFTYDEGDPEIAGNNVIWFSDNRDIANIVPMDENFTWGSITGISRAGKVLPRGIVKNDGIEENTCNIYAAYVLSKNANGEYTIFDSRPITVTRNVVRLKINETPNDDLKVPYGKQKFTVTKIYDTGEEELVSDNDTSNLEWTVTPPGAAFADATTGEVTSLIARDMGVPYVSTSAVTSINEEKFNNTQTDTANLTQTDVLLKVQWRGKNGEIDTNVECDQIHWRIMNKPVKLQILGFDRNIPIGTFCDKKPYSTISHVGEEQEFRAVLTYADGTTDSTLMNKTVYEGQKTAILNGNEQVMGSTDKNNPNYIDEREYIDTFGCTKNIMWTLEYKYDEDFANEVSDTSWKYGTQLNNILDLYTYPFIDIGSVKSGTAAGSKNPYWRIKDENKSSYALIAHITALKPGKGRLYCSYINDPTICDWVDFEIKRSVTEIEIIG